MGCLKNVLAGVGCVVLLAAAVVLGFVYRDRLGHLWRRVRGVHEPPPIVYVTPAPGGAAHAETALHDLTRRGGPAYVDVEPQDLASLIDRELARMPRRVFDSIAVALDSPRVLVKGRLDVSEIPQRLLGPLADGLGRYEPVTAGGVLAVGADGTLRWTLDQLMIRDFPFPASTIPAIVRSFGIAHARDAAVPIPLQMPLGDVRVMASRVRLYRAVPR